MLSPEQMSERLQEVLKKNGFKMETLSTLKDPCDAVYCKSRSSASIYVGVPIKPTVVTKAYVDDLSAKTGIARDVFTTALEGF